MSGTQGRADLHRPRFRDLVLTEVVVSSADQITANQLTSDDFRIAVKELQAQRLPLWIDLHV
jgi:hypothetical protein